MEHCRCENSEKAKTSFSSILYRNDKPSHRFNELSFLSKVHPIRSHPSSKRNVSIESYFGSTIMRQQRRGMYISEDIENFYQLRVSSQDNFILCNLTFINVYSKKHSISRLLLSSDDKNSKYSIDILLNLIKLFTFQRISIQLESLLDISHLESCYQKIK